MTADTYYDFARLAIEPALLVEIVSPQCRVETDDGIVLDVTKAAEDPVFRSADTIARALEHAGAGSAAGFRSLLLQEIGKHLVAVHTDAREAIKALAKLDRGLAVWAACACAREALRYVPEGENRPRIAIETTERWLAGDAPTEEKKQANSDAWDADNLRTDNLRTEVIAAYAADAAAYASHSDDGVLDLAARAAAAAAAEANASDAAAYAAACDAELKRLVSVIAEALPCMPPEVTA